MKATQILLFLLIFVLAIEMINISNVYRIADPSNLGTGNSDIEDGFTLPDEDVQQLEVASLLGRIFSFVTGGIIGGVIFGAGAHYVGGVPADRAFVYGLFATNYWALMVDVSLIFNSIAPWNPGLVMLIAIFLIISGATFMIGFQQLVTGGWQAFM